MLKKQLIALTLFSFSGVSFATESYVVALTGAVTEDDSYLYGVSAYDTKGSGIWGLYGEVLFAYKEDSYSSCDVECTDVSTENTDFSMTIGANYGLTDNLYGLAGVGLRFNTFYTEPLHNASSCDDDDDDDTTTDDSQYCSDTSKIDAAGQLGLLYVAPFGISLAGTVDTNKTVALSLGYQF